MPRPYRFTYPRALHHVTLRCNNREFLFTVPTFELFLELLQAARDRFPISLYNYCLMTNHVHLLFKVGGSDTLSTAMHWLSSRFSQRFNKMRGRKGHLWEGRFRSCIIEHNSYFFRCMAYLDLNPVRAGMVAGPLEYRWCGHRALRDENTDLLDLHPLYLAGGKTRAARYLSYTELLREEAGRPAVSLATKCFVGAPRFVSRMEKKFDLEGGGVSLERETLASDGATRVVCVGRRAGGDRRPN
jgi:putative transposase